MRNIMLLIAAVCIFSACSNQDKVTAPAAPKTVAEVMNSIKGRNYKVDRLGILSSFAMDSANPVNWNIMKEDTSKFFRDYAKTQMTFTINFSKDSTVSFYDTDNKKSIKGIYLVDNDAKLGYEEEKPGIKLRLKYQDSLEFAGGNTASEMTLSYLVRGMNDKELILETGREINSHKLVVWMKAE
ncbi:MAG: hypothetical protein ABJA78_08280 [Ferruginibacter sp.]